VPKNITNDQLQRGKGVCAHLLQPIEENDGSHHHWQGVTFSNVLSEPRAQESSANFEN
jgi:hypothetical protein